VGQISGLITIAGLHIQPLKRHGDRYLMEIAMATPGLSPSHIKMINYCCLFLQVLTLSNICNAEGTKLVECISKGNRNGKQSYSILEEPLQERPNEVPWGIWGRFLQQICYNKYWLMRPLGPWYARLSTRWWWPYYYIPGHDIIQVLQANRTYLFH
jgi:hypothetical protein